MPNYGCESLKIDRKEMLCLTTVDKGKAYIMDQPDFKKESTAKHCSFLLGLKNANSH